MWSSIWIFEFNGFWGKVPKKFTVSKKFWLRIFFFKYWVLSGFRILKSLSFESRVFWVPKNFSGFGNVYPIFLTKLTKTTFLHNRYLYFAFFEKESWSSLLHRETAKIGRSRPIDLHRLPTKRKGPKYISNNWLKELQNF